MDGSYVKHSFSYLFQWNGSTINHFEIERDFGTDYGICSIIKPQLAFNSDLDNVPYWEKIFGKYNWNVTKGTVL